MQGDWPKLKSVIFIGLFYKVRYQETTLIFFQTTINITSIYHHPAHIESAIEQKNQGDWPKLHSPNHVNKNDIFMFCQSIYIKDSLYYNRSFSLAYSTKTGAILFCQNTFEHNVHS